MYSTRLRYLFKPHILLLCILIFVAARAVASAPALSPEEERILDVVNQQSIGALSLLEKTVNINSGTFHLKGVRKVGRVFKKELASLGFEVRWIDMPDNLARAGHLFAYRRGTQGKRLLLIGHLDTVFEKDSPFQRFEFHDSLVTGPGVNDMKGGDVVIVYALKALFTLDLLENTSITVALHGDEEEPGRPIEVSRRDIIAAARESDLALGFEGGIAGTATVARRGISSWQLQVNGIGGHSSAIFGNIYGYGATYEAARILNAFQEEVRGETYLTLNPGVILGGTDVRFDPKALKGTAFGKTNVIAQTVVVAGDLRFIAEEQKQRARENMRMIVQRNLPGTSAAITFRDSYPAMAPTPGNYALLEHYDQVNRDLGYGPIEAFDPGGRGAADVSFVAAFVDCLDGLGVEGSGSHSIQEDMDLHSMLVATQRAALLIYRLTRAH